VYQHGVRICMRARRCSVRECVYVCWERLCTRPLLCAHPTHAAVCVCMQETAIAKTLRQLRKMPADTDKYGIAALCTEALEKWRSTP
jgi:hypothetical protein